MTTDWLTPRMAPYGDSGDLPRRSALDADGVLRRLDWPLLLATVALVAIGTTLIYAKTRDITGSAYITKHAVNIVIGTGLGIGATLIGYETMRALAPFVYGAGILGLLAVLVPGIGIVHNTARSWIRVGGGFEVQPAEFAKVAFIVMLATVLGDRREGESDDPSARRIINGVALAVLPMGLIMLQPDLGTTMVFVFTMVAVLLLAPVKLRWVAGLLVLGVAGAALALSLNVVSQYQVDRLKTFTNPEAGVQKEAFQIYQAEIAVSLGGVSGTGLFKGDRTNSKIVPVQESDFIFTVAGEELGLVGCTTIIGLLGVVMWRGFRIARRSKDRFGSLVAVGVVSWFGIQSFENIGMNIGVMPITGIPLPFISYGGSSMFAVLLAVGFLQNIHLRTERKAH